MSKYQAVIFDAGGTLIGNDDPLGFERDLAAAFADLGVSTGARELADLMNRLQKEARRRRQQIGGWSRSEKEQKENILWVATFLLQNLGVSDDIEGKATEIYDRFEAGAFIDLFSDVRPTLEGLSQRRITMGVLSNYPPFLERNFRLLDIHHYFAFFVVSSMVGLEKPDSRIFQVAVQETGYAQEKILFVGDSPHDDVEGALGVGLDVVLVDRFDRFPDAPCERIRSLTELLKIFQ